MEKSSRTTTSYLFDLCLRVIIKMAKTKAKRVPYRDFNPRDRYSIETWRKVKSLFNQGFKRAQIEDQMKIKLHKRTFFSKEVNSKSSVMDWSFSVQVINI